MITQVQAAHDRLLDLSFTRPEAERYSLGRAILAADNPKEKSFEREVSQTIQAQIGRPTRCGHAIFVPTALRPQASGLDTKTNAAGNYLTGTNVMDLVDALRAQMRTAQLGATWLPGLKFSGQFPIEDGTTTAFWVGENPGIDVGQQDPSYKASTASPKTLQSTCAVSRQLLLQTSQNVHLEARLRADIMRSHAQAFDAAAICGSGLSNEPIGLLKNAGINTVAIATNGGVPTYATICDMEAASANSNAPDSIGFLTTPNVRKLLRKTFTNGTGSEPVWEDNLLLGNTALVSTAVPSTLSKGTSNGTLSAIISGVFSEMVLCEFGVIEITVDPFTAKKKGMVEITGFSMVDVVIPRPAAFAVCLDAALS